MIQNFTNMNINSVDNSAISQNTILTNIENNDQAGAFIKIYADPEGVISPNIIPGKLEISTIGDDGLEKVRLIVDKSGRIISLGQFWAVTSVPTGSPIYALVNSNVSSIGAKVAMRRSRGTFESPTAVQKGDNLFRLVWGGHDGINYRDTASIESNVAGPVKSGVIPSDLTIKTTSLSGSRNTAAKFTIDQTLQIDKISSLNNKKIEFQTPISGDIEGSVFDNNSNKIIDSVDGKITTSSITASKYIKFPVYSNPALRNNSLTNLEAGMVVFLADSTGNGGPPKLQININGTTEGWIDL